MTPYILVAVYRTFRRNVVIVNVITYFLVLSSSLFGIYVAFSPIGQLRIVSHFVRLPTSFISSVSLSYISTLFYVCSVISSYSSWMLSFSPNSRSSSAISKQVFPLTLLYVLGSNRGTETDFIHRVVCVFAQTLQIDAGMKPHQTSCYISSSSLFSNSPPFDTVYS
jgi:hypothetical protein